jgi:seryl-tRNA synthetase
MLDLRFIRENSDLVKEALVKLNTTAPIDEILSLDEQRRGLLSEVEALRARRNAVSKRISGLTLEDMLWASSAKSSQKSQ